jgi:hypothetical protein
MFAAGLSKSEIAWRLGEPLSGVWSENFRMSEAKDGRQSPARGGATLMIRKQSGCMVMFRWTSPQMAN